MIDLFYAPTPNGQKVKLFLDEAGLYYRKITISLSRGEQFTPAFLAISPNNKIPAIVDHSPADGGEPVSLFESGAILLYLAEKTGEFIAREARERNEQLQWLFWQMAGLGPMAGQMGYFNVYAPDKVPSAIDRYRKETRRLYSVIDRRLAGRDYIAGSYSIADMAVFPWIVPHAALGQRLEGHPNLMRWFTAMSRRPALRRTYDGVEDVYRLKGAPVSTGQEVKSAGLDAEVSQIHPVA